MMKNIININPSKQIIEEGKNYFPSSDVRKLTRYNAYLYETKLKIYINHLEIGGQYERT